MSDPKLECFIFKSIIPLECLLFALGFRKPLLVRQFSSASSKGARGENLGWPFTIFLKTLVRPNIYESGSHSCILSDSFATEDLAYEAFSISFILLIKASTLELVTSLTKASWNSEAKFLSKTSWFRTKECSINGG